MQALDLLRANGYINPLDTIELKGTVNVILMDQFHIDVDLMAEHSMIPNSIFIRCTDTSDVYLKFLYVGGIIPTIHTVRIKDLRRTLNMLKDVQIESSDSIGEEFPKSSGNLKNLFKSAPVENREDRKGLRSAKDHAGQQSRSVFDDDDDILVENQPKLDILETSSLRSNKRDLKEPGELGNLELLLTNPGGPSRSFRIKDSYKEKNLRKIDFYNSGFESTPFLIANLAHSDDEYKDSRTVSRIGYTDFMELVHRKMEGHSDFGNLPEMLSYPLNYSPKVGLQEVATAIFIRCMLILYRKDMNSKHLDTIDQIIEEHGDLESLIDDFSIVLKKDPQNYFPQGDDFKIYW